MGSCERPDLLEDDLTRLRLLNQELVKALEDILGGQVDTDGPRFQAAREVLQKFKTGN